MIKVFEAFSGIGAQRMALRNLGIEHEVVAIAEIDKFAIKSYGAIHNDLLNNIIEKTDEEMYEFLENRNVPLNYKAFKCEARKLKKDELKQVYTACVLNNNVGDISKINPNDIPDHDLFTYSFPCQDISVAGKQNGLDKDSGTRSGLLWECEKVIAAKKPKYLLMENVKNLVGKKHKPNFDMWLEWLESEGYSNYWKVINAKDCGVPQNRERVFVVSILNDNEFEFENEKELESKMKDLLEVDVDSKYYLSDKMTRYALDLDGNTKGTKWEDRLNNETLNKKVASTIACRTAGGGQRAGVSNYVAGDGSEEISVKELKQFFEFEPPIELTTRLKDVLESSVEEKFYLDNEKAEQLVYRDVKKETAVRQVGNIVHTGNFDNPQRGRIYSQEGCSPALNTCGGGGLEPKILIKNATKKGYLEAEAEAGDGVDTGYPASNTRRGRVQKGVSQTLTTGDGLGVVDNKLRIRKLTPLECWRLMGFSDEDFYKAEQVCSNTQLYKQAGNSIVVNVLESIFRQMFKEEM